MFGVICVPRSLESGVRESERVFIEARVNMFILVASFERCILCGAILHKWRQVTQEKGICIHYDT